MLVTGWLDHWADATPDTIFLAERNGAGAWQTVSYADFRAKAQGVAQGLVERRLGPTETIAILSGNDLQHAILAMGALYAGVPYVPVSPAYSLVSKDHAKLRWLLHRIDPALIFASDPDAFAHAMRSAAPSGREIVHTITELTAAGFQPVPVTPDSTAKILFTSGSTGKPKGVINTHRMLVSNQAALAAALGRTDESTRPIVCDWLPWHHTFGGNHNFGFVLSNGGTLYIDAGRPTPDAFGQSLWNLDEVCPTAYFNVPLGFDLLRKSLSRDARLRERFFSRMELLYSAAASLSPDIKEELLQLAGRSLTFAGGFGATETGPLTFLQSGCSPHNRFIGRPVSGVDIKLVPAGEKRELCVRGPNVMPGYWKEEASSPFDPEGYYRTGDAVRYVNPDLPDDGLCYEGRLSEDFKLSSGTWIDAGALRDRLLTACTSLVRDCVIVGEDQARLAVLIFPDEAAAMEPAYEAQLKERLQAFAAASTGSSNRIEAAFVLTSPVAEEITEKGSLNRAEILKNRAEAVAELFHPRPSDRVITIS